VYILVFYELYAPAKLSAEILSVAGVGGLGRGSYITVAEMRMGC
jgi:hypothetical protein